MAQFGQFLPGTGRWQREALTEGGGLHSQTCVHSPAPSATLRAIPLPVTGRN